MAIAMDDHTMPATLVSTRGGIGRTIIQTHPIPRVIHVNGWPFTLEQNFFLLTGKAVYVGYYPSEEPDDE